MCVRGEASWSTITGVPGCDAHVHINAAQSYFLKHECHGVVLIFFVEVLLDIIVEFCNCCYDEGHSLGAVIEDLDNLSKQLVWIYGNSCIPDCSIAVAASHHEDG